MDYEKNYLNINKYNLFLHKQIHNEQEALFFVKEKAFMWDKVGIKKWLEFNCYQYLIDSQQ